MVTALYVILAFATSVGAGLLCALLGLGGGVVLVPTLVFLLDVPMHLAIGTSIVAIVATSSAASATYVRDGLTNMRLGMFLELSSATGALAGAFVAISVDEALLQVLFGAILIYASYAMLHGRSSEGGWRPASNDPWASRLRLGGSYYDAAEGKEVSYGVTRTPLTFGISYLAGMVSGLLGIGGGSVKVPAMNMVSRIPIKAAVATSNFMIGVTAAASAIIYLNRQYVQAFIAAPAILGVLLGATIAPRLANRVRGDILKKIFILVMLLAAVKFILSGLGVYL